MPATFTAVSLCLLLSISEADNACLKMQLGQRQMHSPCLIVCERGQVGPGEPFLTFVLIACDCGDPLPVDSACVVICSVFICLIKGHLLSTCSGAGTVGRL